MTESQVPKGEERQVRAVGGASIDGAPIAYIIVWAAVLVVLSYIPIPVSAVLGIGGTFPMSQAANSTRHRPANMSKTASTGRR